MKRMWASTVGSIALAGLLLAGCGTSSKPLPPPVRQSATATATPTPSVIQAISSTYAADETPVYLAAQDLIRASTTANPSTTLILSDTQVVASAVTKFDQQLATLAASAPPNVANALRVEEVDNEAVVRDIGAEVAAKTQAALAAAQTALNSEGMSATTAANAVKTDLGLPTCPSSITC